MHIYASLKGGMVFKEKLYGYEELEKLSPDIFILGHYHIDQGIHEQNKKYFVNIGSMTRGAISEEDIDHHPQIGFIRISVEDNIPTYIIRPIRLKINPADEVFDIEKKIQEKKENEEIKLFVERLASEAMEDSSNRAKTIDDVIAKMKIIESVRKRVFYFIHEASK